MPLTLRVGRRDRATAVDSEQYLLRRYAEHKPVWAGLVGHARNYSWSSDRHNGRGEAELNADNNRDPISFFD
jgi:hypothetical protein